MADNKVRFLVGTKVQYESISPDNNTLYWLTDVHELRKGTQLYGVGREASSTAAGLLSAEDKVKLDALASGVITDIQSVDNVIKVEVDAVVGGKRNLKIRLSLDPENLIEVDNGANKGLKLTKSKIVESLSFKTPYNKDSNKIVTEKDLEDIASGMRFRGIYNNFGEVDSPRTGDIIIIGQSEYIYTANPSKWNELGSEGAYLTKAEAETKYLTKTEADSKYVIAGSGSSYEGLVENVTETKEKLDDVSDKVDDVTDKVNDISDNVNSISDDLEDVNDRVDDINDKLTDVFDKIDETSDKLDTTIDDVDEVKDKVDTIKSNLVWGSIAPSNP